MAITSSGTVKWLTDIRFLIALYVVLALVATLQSILLEPKLAIETGYSFPHYNNYLIFKQSFFHLLGHQDLYVEYPAEHWDYYKYTPTFSLFFGPLALLPDFVGLPIWHMLNGVLLLLAIFSLPGLTPLQKGWIGWLGCIETMTAMQNEQSNGLIAALMIFAFSLLERKQFFLAILCLMGSVFIKPFGIVGFALLAFYKGKIKLTAYSIVTGAVLFALPLLVISSDALIGLYQSWLKLLSADHAAKYGLSVLGWLHTWFSVDLNKNLVTLFGALAFAIPYIRFKAFHQQRFRLLSLSSILIWVVIFNHMAESPTYVLAMTGASIWFFVTKRDWPDIVLFLLVFCSISLTSTDLVPRGIRNEWIKPYVLKAVPCILLWMKIIFEMMTITSERPSTGGMQPIGA